MTLLILFVTATLTAAVSATIGMAGGLILLSVLTLFMPMQQAIPLHGFAQFTSNIGRVVSYYRYIQWPIAWRFVALTLPGAYIGVKAATAVHPTWLEGAVGLAILWMMHGPKFGKRSHPSPNFFIWLGFFSSSVGMIAGATGPMIAPFFTRVGLDKRQMVATKAFCQSVVQLLKLPFFAVFGAFSFTAHWQLLVLFVIAAVIGQIIGKRIIDALSDHHYEAIIKWSVTLLAARMVVMSAWELSAPYR